MPYTPTSPEDRAALLAAAEQLREELFQQIPDALRLKDPLDLPPGLSELELRRELEEPGPLRTRPRAPPLPSWAGALRPLHPLGRPRAGQSRRVLDLLHYQPEVSQGTLQVIFGFQSLICALSGMEVANASIYDGATSMAEGAIMLAEPPRHSSHPTAGNVLGSQ